ncbi:hypothetical protein ACQ4LE_009527 [Meloidogyne hapla]
MPEDFQTVENSLDRRFPEVRQLFKLKYEEIKINTKQFNNKTIDELFEEFKDISSDIAGALTQTMRYSYYIFIVGDDQKDIQKYKEILKC